MGSFLYARVGNIWPADHERLVESLGLAPPRQPQWDSKSSLSPVG